MALPQESTSLRRCLVTIPPKLEAELTLSDTSLRFCTSQNTTRSILLEDLIGIVLLPQLTNEDQVCRMVINDYPLVSGHRSIRQSFINFCQEETYSGNHSVAQDWKEAALNECEKAMRKIFAFPEEMDTSEVKVNTRQLLVLVNPASGQGKSVELFQTQVQPMFDMAELKYTVVVTERANHSRELVKEYDLSSIDGIVIASGDGLLYEVINGLMERPDWQQAIKTPIGMLPTGSGNALATSILHEAEEEYSLTNAAFCIVRGGIQATSLATVQEENGTKTMMSLMSCWGYIADVDIESERFRFMGDTRFTVGALLALFKKKTYRGRLHYLPLEEDENLNQPASNDSEQQCSRPPTNLLPPSLKDPVPSNWKTIEMSFHNILVLTIPFLAKGFVGNFNCSIGTDKLFINYTSGDISRWGILSMLLNAETGDNIKREDSHYIMSRAYRLEPLTAPGTIVVDGEPLEYAPHQVQIHPHLARVMTRKRNSS